MENKDHSEIKEREDHRGYLELLVISVHPGSELPVQMVQRARLVNRAFVVNRDRLEGGEGGAQDHPSQ